MLIAQSIKMGVFCGGVSRKCYVYATSLEIWVARLLGDILKSQRKKRRRKKKSQVGISVFLKTGPFIFSSQTARPRNRLPSALPNSAVALIMTRAKNQSKHSWASQVGGAKRQKRLGAAQAQQWYWKKNKKQKKHLCIARHPSPPLGFLSFPPPAYGD